MAIPENIATALAGNKEVLDFVTGLDARASKLTPELEADLPKLGEYKGHAAAVAKILGETKAKDVEALLTDFKNLKSVNTDLLQQKERWKADGKGKDSPEYLALEEKLKEQGTAMEGILAKMKAAEDKATAADAAKRETDLKASMVSAASKLKARNPEDEFLLLKAKGLVGYKEDGTPFFNKLNAEGKPVAVANADELMGWHLGLDKSKIDPSGKQGAGASHTGGEGGGAELPKDRASARAAFRNARAAS